MGFNNRKVTFEIGVMELGDAGRIETKRILTFDLFSGNMSLLIKKRDSQDLMMLFISEEGVEIMGEGGRETKLLFSTPNTH